MQLTREGRKRRPGSGYKEAGPTPEAREAAIWLEQGEGGSGFGQVPPCAVREQT